MKSYCGSDLQTKQVLKKFHLRNKDHKIMTKQLLHQTFTNLLTSSQREHHFTPQQISAITQAIVSTDRSSLDIHQQLRGMIKRLQEHSLTQDEKKKTFNRYEIEWILNWLMQAYVGHVRLVGEVEREMGGNQENEGKSRQLEQKEGNNMQEIDLVVEAPTFVEPLSRAKLMREGAARIFVAGEDVWEAGLIESKVE